MAQENVFIAASSSHGETEDVLGGCASSIAVSPDFLTPMQSLSSCSVHSRAEAATTSAAGGPSSPPFFSARIHSLSERRNDFRSEVEFEIESSKSHWTETSVATSDCDAEDQRVRDRFAFEKLKEHAEWGPFFRRQPYELEMGGKIAAGGQADIFEALGTNKRDEASSYNAQKRLVVKVFKKGFCLEDVQRWWPPGLASAALPHRYFRQIRPSYPYVIACGFAAQYGLCFPVGAQLLEDGRFAFIFVRFWGDYRKLIDKRMLKSNGAPPFSLKDTYQILMNIAKGMVMLHECGLLHKDLKAANVLAAGESGLEMCTAYIADFESSDGIKGTGFWRAPEVLLAKKNGNLKEETFTQQSDVYSYAMTCYEFLTGQFPFEDHNLNDYDPILRGERPPLPDDIDPFFEDLVRKCWHADPLQRPSFHEIVAVLETIADK